jgi:uncharacterized protein (DUF362 family)
LAGSAAGLAGLTALGTGSLWAAEDKPLDMAVAKWAGAQGLDDAQIDQAAGKLVEQAVGALGGMARFVKKGDVVWVKPNIGWDRRPEQAANTNPQLVAAVIRMCLDAGAKTVKVGDNPVHAAQKTYESSGIAAAAKQAGAEVVFLDRSRFRTADIAGERLKEIPVYPEIIDCDLVINVPVVKHHVLSKLTMCMKNHMGVIDKRNTLHQGLPDCLTDLTRYMQPRARLHILDGVRALVAHGPVGGNLQDVRVKLAVAAGTDIVALDAWGAEIAGRSPAEIESISKAQQAGLGKINYRTELAWREIPVS